MLGDEFYIENEMNYDKSDADGRYDLVVVYVDKSIGLDFSG